MQCLTATVVNDLNDAEVNWQCCRRLLQTVNRLEIAVLSLLSHCRPRSTHSQHIPTDDIHSAFSLTVD